MNGNLAEEPDGRLVERALSGEERAFAEIVRRNKRQLFGIVIRIVPNEQDALEILQEGFVSAYTALRRYDPARPLGAWLAAIALNKARDWRRREAVRRVLRSLLPIGAAFDVVDGEALADVTVSDRQELALVRKRIAQLPVRLQEVIVLRTLEGMSQAETAAILQISEKAVETRLYRARRKLQEDDSA
ncbi:MAG: RNA polymerase sigma factor [Mycobacterium sp.]